jgi:hypothetical protein
LRSTPTTKQPDKRTTPRRSTAVSRASRGDAEPAICSGRVTTPTASDTAKSKTAGTARSRRRAQR